MWSEGPGAGSLVDGRASRANRLEGGLQNGACQHQCLCGSTSSSNFCHQHVCPQGELQLSPASPGVSPRSANGSDPGSFQITASALGLRSCEILCVPYKNRIFVSYRPPDLLYVSPASLQGQTFWGCFFLVQDPRAGEPNVGFRSFDPWLEPLQL